MLDKFTLFLNDKLSVPMGKLSRQRHLQAVRDGIIATLPLIIVGSFFLIIAVPPLPANWAITEFLVSNAGTIMLPFRMTMFIMSIYAAFGIGYSLSTSYKLDGVSGGIISLVAFLCTIVPVAVSADADVGVSGWVMPMGNLGGGGMFVAILTSILAVEIYRITNRSKFKISMPPQVPPAVARSFEALTPTIVVVVGMATLTYFLNFDWHGIMGTIVGPLINAADSLPSVLLLVFVITLFWSFGIHGISIVGSIARPIWIVLLDANTTAVAGGYQPPAIAPEPFYQWFIWIGGSGATIGLAILLVTITKSKYGSSLGKTAFLPALFNINEPLIFGTPVVLNAMLIIPFIVAPTINAIIAWFATSWGLVNPVVVTAPWTLPGPIGAYLATGGDYRAIILNIILIILSVVIYYPFVKMYDAKLLAEESGVENTEN